STRFAISRFALRPCPRPWGGNASTPWTPEPTPPSEETTRERAPTRSPPTRATATRPHARLLADLIHMAFVCDMTRVATLQITVFQSQMNVFPITDPLGVPVHADLHECGHNGDAQTRGQIPVSTCLQWHISHYAYLLNKLKNTPEGAGNVLDNSAIVFMPEAAPGLPLHHSER